MIGRVVALCLALCALGVLLPYGYARLSALWATWSLVPLGSLVWAEPGIPRFGGLSGIEISPDGGRIVVVSDRPYLFRADLVRRGETITEVRLTSQALPLTASGAAHDAVENDFEGLALAQDGRLWVSIELNHGVEVFAPGAIQSTSPGVAGPSPFDDLPLNRGLEALALDGQGRPIAIAESASGDAFPVWRLDAAGWTALPGIPRRGPYLPVGADTDDAGTLYLLERSYLPPFWFSSRIRRFAITEAGLEERDTLLRTAYGAQDNLEGLAVWTGPEGDTRLTLISDDNFLPFQRTEIVEFAVPRAAP